MREVGVCRSLIWALSLFVIVAVTASTAHAGSAVVTNGKFTNIYVFPGSDRETWEQHMARLRPSDAAQFSRAAIDRFTDRLMRPVWPSYFDPLFQYSGIHPPRFFGSAVATKACVDAALKDLHNGVLQWDTIRSLSNCHIDGHDPSPQVTLIFSPDIKIGKIVPFGTSGDMCAEAGAPRAWHAWGLNTPNFIALPTSQECVQDFKHFTQLMSHEVIETISDPGGMGMGDFGVHELGDNCEDRPDGFTMVNDRSLARYWSNFDKNCQPRLDPPSGSVSTTWVLGIGFPLQRFTGDVHDLTLSVPRSRVTTAARATDIQLVIQTGGDDLRAGSDAGDNATATLHFRGGTKTTVNINGGRSWENGETHAVHLALPSPAPPVNEISAVTISTHFGGGIGGDNWNVDKVALVVSFPKGSATRTPPPTVVHEWLNASGAPLVRFTGETHNHREIVRTQDAGKQVRALNLVISTGNDDLRGGSSPGDNCTVTVELASGKGITLNNVNGGHTWEGWTDHTVSIPLPAGGLKGGDIKAVWLHTDFGGGIGGDNWNVNRIQLQATLQ